jgi:hypothetical protein
VRAADVQRSGSGELLAIDGLSVDVAAEGGPVRLVNEVSFAVGSQ